MELHHDKHHAAYVKGANQALEKLDEAREKEDFTRVGALEKALAFNLSGHVLHSLFWQNLTPQRRRPAGRASCAPPSTSDFGSFEKFKRQLNEVAATIMGSGWGALVWEPLAGKLLTTQIYDHQSNLSQGGVPHPRARRLGARVLPPVQEPEDRLLRRRSGTSGTGRTSPSASPRSARSTCRSAEPPRSPDGRSARAPRGTQRAPSAGA